MLQHECLVDNVLLALDVHPWWESPHAFAGGGAPPAFAGEPGASTCGPCASRHSSPRCKRCNCSCGKATSASDRGRARADCPLLLSRSANRPTDPATEDARASLSSPSATSSLAWANESCLFAVSRLARAKARRRSLSVEEATELTPELLELRTTSIRGGEVVPSCADTAGAAGADGASLFAGGTTASFPEVSAYSTCLASDQPSSVLNIQ